MKIYEKFQQDVAVLTIKGDLMGGPESMVLHEKIKSLVNDKIKKVVVDLSHIEYMNSSGLGILMAGFGTIAQAGGMIKLAGTTGKVKSLLVITQLIQFFEDYENADHAVAAYINKVS